MPHGASIVLALYFMEGLDYGGAVDARGSGRAAMACGAVTEWLRDQAGDARDTPLDVVYLTSTSRAWAISFAEERQDP